MRVIAGLVAAFAALIAAPLSAQDFPELTGRVIDEANIIPDDLEERLTQQLDALEQQSQRQLVVVTLNNLQGYDISDYGYQLGREWGIGDADRNDGALLIVAPNERKVRIEVGYGLEGIMTDALSSLIIQNAIIPRFRADDYPGGISAGVYAIQQQLMLPEDEARQIATDAGKARDRDSGFPIGGLIWFALIFFFFILPMLGGRGRRRRFGGAAGNIILWEVGSAIARGAMSSGSSSSGFGGGFSGGGFSGGGGSFGGGGASGGW